jgi:LuxR family maltose regulon positive regulatory protein
VAAARHAAAAHDWDFFCDLLIEDMQVPALIDRHRVDEVSRTLLLDTLPAEACSAAASVLRAAVAVGRGAPAQATEQLQRASAGNPRRREPLELTLSANLVRQAVGVAVTGRVDVSVSELTRRMLQQLPPARRSAHPMLTALVAMYHGIGVAGSGTSDETLTALGDAVATWTAVPDASRGSGELALDCLGLLAAAQVTSGNLRTGTALAHRARRLAEHFGAAGRDGVLAADVATAWASAQRGDYAAAQTWATRARHRVDNDPGAIVMPLLAAVQARIRRARGQLPQALGLLDSIDTSRSPSWIRQCLSADTRNVRLTSRCTAAAVDTLPLEAADRSEPSELDGPVRPPMAHLFERLTARETDVLRFLAQLYSTQEIAAAMYVSPNTVRTHVRGILRKLDVPRRNMAVRRARELQLI